MQNIDPLCHGLTVARKRQPRGLKFGAVQWTMCAIIENIRHAHRTQVPY